MRPFLFVLLLLRGTAAQDFTVTDTNIIVATNTPTQCPILACCDNDCCGTGTTFSGRSCVPDPNSLGWSGQIDPDFKAGCADRACCEAGCCAPGTIYDTSTLFCIPTPSPPTSPPTRSDDDGLDYARAVWTSINGSPAPDDFLGAWNSTNLAEAVGEYSCVNPTGGTCMIQITEIIESSAESAAAQANIVTSAGFNFDAFVIPDGLADADFFSALLNYPPFVDFMSQIDFTSTNTVPAGFASFLFRGTLEGPNGAVEVIMSAKTTTGSEYEVFLLFDSSLFQVPEEFRTNRRELIQQPKSKEIPLSDQAGYHTNRHGLSHKPPGGTSAGFPLPPASSGHRHLQVAMVPPWCPTGVFEEASNAKCGSVFSTIMPTCRATVLADYLASTAAYVKVMDNSWDAWRVNCMNDPVCYLPLYPLWLDSLNYGLMVICNDFSADMMDCITCQSCCIVGDSCIGGIVLFDADNSLSTDPNNNFLGDTPSVNVGVELFDSTLTYVIASTATDETGCFTFETAGLGPALTEGNVIINSQGVTLADSDGNNPNLVTVASPGPGMDTVAYDLWFLEG